MTFGQVLIGVLLPYAVIAFFLVGMIRRILRWAREPQLLKWTLFPVPSSGRKILLILYQILGFRSLFRYNRGLWLGAWLFHLSLWAVLVWHLIRFAGLEASFWMTAEQWIDTVGKWILLASTLYLVSYRIAVGSMRAITGTSDYFNLAVMSALVLTGLYLKGNVDPYETGIYLVSLITFSPQPLPEGGLWMILHWLLALLVLAMLPYGKMSHLFSQFFLKLRIDWVDWRKRPYPRVR